MQKRDVSPDILADLYREITAHRQDGGGTLRRIGRSYLDLADRYGLQGADRAAIEKLCALGEETVPQELEEYLLKADLQQKGILRREREAFESVCREFDPHTQLALEKFSAILGQVPVSYRVKDRCLHLVLVDLPSMKLSLDFEDVLIEDGRNPRQIIMDRLRIEKAVSARRAVNPGGAETMQDQPAWRVSFFNRLSEPYPVRPHSFTCTRIRGKLGLYDYVSYPGPSGQQEGRKLAWERLYGILQALSGKYRYLGAEGLSRSEKELLPLAAVFEQLIGLYLDPGSACEGREAEVLFDRPAAMALVLKEEDLAAACRILRLSAFEELSLQLERAGTDRIGFIRFWIRFMGDKSCARLYSFLMDQLSVCGGDYPRHPLPLSYRRFHAAIRRHLDAQLPLTGWQGSFPCYYMLSHPPAAPAFLYSRQYPGKGSEGKVLYLDFLEAVDGAVYTLKTLTCEILLRNGEEPQDFCALDGCFADGARRSLRMGGALEMTDTDDGRVLAMAADLARQAAGQGRKKKQD